MPSSTENVKHAKNLTGVDGVCFGNEMVLLNDNTLIYVGDPISVQVTNKTVKIFREFDDRVTTQTFKYITGSPVDYVFTQAEAASIYNKDASTILNAIDKGYFPEDEYRKSGRITLISKEAMSKVYKTKGAPLSDLDKILKCIRNDPKLLNVIYRESDLTKLVESLLIKYKIEHTEVWQNPDMIFSIRVYNGPENRIMNFFFKELKTNNLFKKSVYIFEDISLGEFPVEFN